MVKIFFWFVGSTLAIDAAFIWCCWRKATRPPTRPPTTPGRTRHFYQS